MHLFMDASDMCFKHMKQILLIFSNDNFSFLFSNETYKELFDRLFVDILIQSVYSGYHAQQIHVLRSLRLEHISVS